MRKFTYSYESKICGGPTIVKKIEFDVLDYPEYHKLNEQRKRKKIKYNGIWKKYIKSLIKCYENNGPKKTPLDRLMFAADEICIINGNDEVFIIVIHIDGVIIDISCYNIDDIEIIFNIIDVVFLNRFRNITIYKKVSLLESLLSADLTVRQEGIMKE